MDNKEKKNEHDGTKSDVSYTYWQQVYEELAKQNDGYKQITVSDGTATVAFGRLGNQRASDRYTFDPAYSILSPLWAVLPSR